MIGIAPLWLSLIETAIVFGFAARAWFQLRTAVDAALAPDDVQKPTHRMVLWSLRRAARSGGFFMLGMGILILPQWSSAMGPLAIGLITVLFPAWQNSDAVKAWIPTTDHKEPIGPVEGRVRDHLEPIGPPTLRDWLDQQD